MVGRYATKFVLPSGVTLTPDTCTAQAHNYSAETTMHPVEDGSSIADNVIKKPASLSFTTLWTPRPPDDTYEPPAGDDRPSIAFVYLTEALLMRQPIRIVVDNVTYDPVVLTSVQMPRAFEDGDSRTLTVEAQEIQIVSGKTVKVKVSPSLKSKGKKKKTNKTPIYTIGKEAYVGLEHGEYIFAAGHDW